MLINVTEGPNRVITSLNLSSRALIGINAEVMEDVEAVEDAESVEDAAVIEDGDGLTA